MGEKQEKWAFARAIELYEAGDLLGAQKMILRALPSPIPPGNNISHLNARGQWVPAVPLPLFGPLRKVCDCGARFWTLAGYHGHYAYAHILGMHEDESSTP